MNEDTIRAGAEATKEVAVTSGKAIDLTRTLMQYFDGMLQAYAGKHEENANFSRFKNRLRIMDETAKILQQRGIDSPTREIPIKFALPLLTYAGLEEDADLQALWAKLLANAADASSGVELHTTYVDILKDLTAFDAKNLSLLAQLSVSDFPQAIPVAIEPAGLPETARVHTTMSGELAAPSSEVALSLSNLQRTGCIAPGSSWGGMPVFTLVYVTPIGLGLYRACCK